MTRLGWVVVLSLLLGGVSERAAAFASGVGDWGVAFMAPALGGSGIDAAGRKIAIGHLELTFSDGRLIPVKVKDRVVGAFFVGHGGFRYVSTEPIEAETYRQNIDRATDYELDKEGGFGDNIEAALVMLSSGAEALVDDAKWLEGEAAPVAVDRFARQRTEWLGDWGWRYESVLPQTMVDPPKEPLAFAQLDAARHDLLYVRDTLRGHDESLLRLWNSDSDLPMFKDLRYQDLLSQQPIGRKRLDPRPPRFVLVDVDGTLVNADGQTAEAKVRQVVETRVPLRTLDFSLMSRRYGSAGATGRAASSPYTLKSVTDASGKPLAFHHAYDFLVVELADTVAAGTRVELNFEMQGDILFRPGNDNYWSIGDDWFPTPGRRDQEGYSYHVVAKVKTPFTAFSSGEMIRRWDEGELACAEFRAKGPIQGAVLIAGKYTTHTQKAGERTINVSAYGLNKPDAMKRIAGMAAGFIAFYEPMLGPYPWSELNILEINDYGFGVAPPGVIYITKEAFVPTPMDEVANLVIKGINGRIAHEVAHAWWGNSTLLGSSEENWLWEATADYYAAYAMSKLRKKGDFDTFLREWRRGAKESSKRGSILLANQLAGKETFTDRSQLLYNKGPLVLHALRQEIGDDNTFFTILKSFQRSFRGQPAYTKDFIGITNFILKKDMTAFFDKYLLGTELPEEK